MIASLTFYHMATSAGYEESAGGSSNTEVIKHEFVYYCEAVFYC